MAVGAHVPLRFVRAAVRKGIAVLKSKLPTEQVTTKVILEPARVPIRNSHINNVFRNRVAGRWYTTAARNFLRFSADVAVPRATRAPPVRSTIARSTNYSPFASTLRPNLTGGAFPRSSGGYSLGGHGARYFSHTPAAPAQVMSQVSAAMRALIQSGKGQMDSYRRFDGKLGKVGVRAQLAASLVQENAPGAYVDFDLSPTITSITPFQRANNTLENEEFVTGLTADFGAMIKHMTAVFADVKRLSSLGDLPVCLTGRSSDVLRVRFSGCDRDFVERLCDEIGVTRGVVHEDERFALHMLAPGIAPAWKDMMNDSPPLSSTYSEDGFDDYGDEGYDMASVSEGEFFDPVNRDGILVDSPGYSSASEDYRGLEGVHRFLEQCDEYREGLSAWR